MAEFIQSEIRVIHTVETNSPTSKIDDTLPQPEFDNVGASDTTADKKAKGSTRRMLGKTAIYRRSLNYSIAAVERIANSNFDNRIRQANLYGDKRQMAKIQNDKVLFNGITNRVKSLGGAAITSWALRNPWILALQAADWAMDVGNTISNANEQRNYEIERQNAEMYRSNRKRERMIIGTYNRR